MRRGSGAPAESAGRNVTRPVRGYPVRVLVAAIELYRHMVSPLRLPTCRFTPTCSQYAVEALTEYGLIRGSWLASLRLGKCGPWHRGGWDPIPGRHEQWAERRGADDAGGALAKRGESESFV